MNTNPVNETQITLNEFKNGKATLWELNDSIYYCSITNPSLIQQSFDLIKTDESDASLLITLLIWVNPNSILQDPHNDTTPFTHFLNTLRKSNSSFFNEEIKWYLTDNNHFVFEKNNLLFIINNNDYDIISQLPDNYSQCTLCCENCNEEIEVNNTLEIPSKTFYILSKIA